MSSYQKVRHFSLIRNLSEFFLNKKRKLMLSKDECEDVIEKTFPRDQRLSSLSKPRDAKRVILGTNFSITLIHVHS